MAKDKKPGHDEFVYVGEHEQVIGEPVEKTPITPSVEVARNVALSVLAGDRGMYRPSDHFGLQMADRNFDVLDCEYAIRNGECREAGKYCPDYKSHKYVFRSNIDGVDFEAVFALSAQHDLINSPLMFLITGVWKTKSGRRRFRY